MTQKLLAVDFESLQSLSSARSPQRACVFCVGPQAGEQFCPCVLRKMHAEPEAPRCLHDSAHKDHPDQKVWGISCPCPKCSLV